MGDKPLIFWRTTSESFDDALTSFYNEGSVDACAKNLKYQCPGKWQDLKPKDRCGVRFCEGCNENVYLISNDEESAFHREHGHCIAQPHAPDSEYLTMGLPG